MAFASGQEASSFAQRAGAASTTGTHPPSQKTEVLTVFLFLKLRRENLPHMTRTPSSGHGHPVGPGGSTPAGKRPRLGAAA